MKVELEIDGSQIGDSVIDLFKSLTEDQKKEIAVRAMSGWLQEPWDVEYAAFKNRLLIDFKNGKHDEGGYHNFKNKNDSEIESHYKFREEIRKFQSSREEMVNAVKREVVDEYREAVKKLVSEDEKLRKKLYETLEIVSNDFPKYVHDAMVAWFCSHLGALGESIAIALRQSNQGEIQRLIEERLIGSDGSM